MKKHKEKNEGKKDKVRGKHKDLKKIRKLEKAKKKEDKKVSKDMEKVKREEEEKKRKEEKKEAMAKKKKGPLSKKKQFWLSFFISIFLGGTIYFFTRSILNSSLSFLGILVLLNVYFIVRKSMKKYADIKKMDDVFPDFISLMSSNLRAGMTVDRALLLSSKAEFAPLDKEILLVGKDIMTGRDIASSLREMGERINSEEIKKTIQLITSGIRSGGNISVLLEETSTNMRERIFVKKKASSNVLMYVIFIFFAVAAGAPALFGLSSVLVEILASLLSDLPTQQVSVSLPFALTELNLPTQFVLYFSIVFVLVTDVMASLVIGLVNKGRESDGTKFIVPLVAISMSVFFTVRLVLLKYFSGVFG